MCRSEGIVMAMTTSYCVPEFSQATGARRPRGSTSRVQRLALEAVTRVFRPYAEQQALAVQYAPTGDGHRYAQAAQYFADVHTRLTPVIREGELIVGARLRDDNPERYFEWQPDGLDYHTDFAKQAPEHLPAVRAMAERGLISPVGALCHRVADYPALLQAGSRALAAQARARAEATTGDAREFALAFAMGHEAMIAHARGYAAACLRLAETATPERAAELREIARICAKVPAEPAETFHEALQCFWFGFMVAGWDIGRIDQFLYPYYAQDLAAGRLTPAAALELIECLLIKLHQDHLDWFANVSSVHTLTLGGLRPDGSDGTNELTRLFLDAIHHVRLLRPTIYLRCHAGTPDDVLEKAMTMLGEGLAEPSFYHDQPIIDGLVRLGVPVEDARDYAIGGCTEVILPGRGNWAAPTGWINVAMLVDDALRACARQDGDRETAWALISEGIEQVCDAVQASTAWCDAQAGVEYETSILMPCCLARGVDMAHGGAESYYAHWAGVGLSNAADMLNTAESMAFSGGMALAELYARLDADDPALRSAIRDLPKFGNDAPAVDDLTHRVLVMLADALERRSTPLRQRLVLGHLSGGQNMHIDYGRIMGATLDGRRAGQPLADSLAGAQGRATSGPTALVASLCRLDHSRMVAGNVSTLLLNERNFATAESRRQVVSLLRTYMALGGSQLQLNVVDAATLRKAQEQPEEYRGLMVRVAGYSADFTHVGRTLQDEIIARSEGLG